MTAGPPGMSFKPGQSTACRHEIRQDGAHRYFASKGILR
jgi:hypothetical protein